MPLLKPDALPVSTEDVAALRARLQRPYQYELVEREDRRLLFVRTTQSNPDPVVDLERGLDRAPAWVLDGLTDVVLLGQRVDLRVPGHIARPVLEARLRLDAEIARHARSTLDVQYGVGTWRHAADPPGTGRLLARVPRDRCAEISEADLLRLAQHVGPLHEAGTLRTLHACHLVAELDQLRFQPDEFVGDLVERWRTQKPSPPTPGPSAPPTPLPMETKALSPKRVEDVTPLFEIEMELPAMPSDTVLASPLREAESVLAHALREAGYAVVHGAFLERAPFAMEANRSLAFPHRVGVLTRPRLDRTQADEALHLVWERELDLLLILCSDPSAEAMRRLAVSKVKVIKPHEAADFRP